MRTENHAMPLNEHEISEQAADWEWLLSSEGEKVLQTLQKRNINDELKRVSFLREKLGLTLVRAALAAEQMKLRERGREKFGDLAEKMFFTPVGLEQSTDRWIAEYKSRRFPADLPIADVCSGIGGDLMAFGRDRKVLGVDFNPLTAKAAEHNLGLVFKNDVPQNDSAELPRGKTVPISAEEFLARYSPDEFPCLHIDPDRRSEGVRASQMAWFEPGQEVIESLLAGRTAAAVKLAPGTKVPSSWINRATELEWIGRNRECRQQVIWFGGIRGSESGGGKHRATLLAAHSSEVLGTFSGAGGLPLSVSEKPEKFVFDLDPVILAAGLEGALARFHGLKSLGPGSLYLTGNEPILNEPFLSCFEILEVLPLDRKQIVRAVRNLEWNQLEIKKRGAVPEPETVRGWFRFPKNGKKGVLILAQFMNFTCAILANRIKFD
ncbi:MAG: hypothetical protein Q4D17_01090 [Planctomycetia bacterium]|nr:hypothetical protein [Planctomycetia bacterium]